MGFFWGGGSLGLGFLGGLREDGGTKEYLVRSFEEVEEETSAVERKWRERRRRSFFWRENLPPTKITMLPFPRKITR